MIERIFFRIESVLVKTIPAKGVPKAQEAKRANWLSFNVE